MWPLQSESLHSYDHEQCDLMMKKGCCGGGVCCYESGFKRRNVKRPISFLRHPRNIHTYQEGGGRRECYVEETNGGVSHSHMSDRKRESLTGRSKKST